MTDDTLTDGAGREITDDQMETWIIAQAIRNELEIFHGGGAIDPEHPESGRGFITDKQMRALNIVIRRTVHDALRQLRIMGTEDADPEEQQRAGRFCWWQLNGVHDYMEPPGTEELEQAYHGVTGEDTYPSER